jgi:succinate dehydrogenase / fumarate reductase membrane anchor subunit
MRYLTDRKRAEGLGSAKSGTQHFWNMQVSAVALAILVPLFVLTFGSILGAPYVVVLEFYSQPIPAIIAGLTLVVGFLHFKNGAAMMLEDYVHGGTLKALVIGVTCISYGAIATGLFALIKLAL